MSQLDETTNEAEVLDRLEDQVPDDLEESEIEDEDEVEDEDFAEDFDDDDDLDQDTEDEDI